MGQIPKTYLNYKFDVHVYLPVSWNILSRHYGASRSKALGMLILLARSMEINTHMNILINKCETI